MIQLLMASLAAWSAGAVHLDRSQPQPSTLAQVASSGAMAGLDMFAPDNLKNFKQANFGDILAKTMELSLQQQ